MAKKTNNKKTEQAEAAQQETGAQEAQRLTREATKSRAGGPLGPTVDTQESTDSPQPGTEDVPDAK